MEEHNKDTQTTLDRFNRFEKISSSLEFINTRERISMLDFKYRYCYYGFHRQFKLRQGYLQHFVACKGLLGKKVGKQCYN